MRKLLPLLLACAPMSAAVYSTQPAQGHDNFVDAVNTINNNGAVDYIVLGSTDSADTSKHRATLIRFDLTALNAATIHGATFYTYLLSGGWVDRGTIVCYRILPSNAGWVEGGGSGVAWEGASCWAMLAYRDLDPTSWAGGQAGCLIPGVDISTAPLGTAVALGDNDWAQGREIAYEFSDLTEVTAMRDNNAGFVAVQTLAQNAVYYACSSEHATEAWRPKLVVEYTPPTPVFCDVCTQAVQAGGDW